MRARKRLPWGPTGFLIACLGVSSSCGALGVQPAPVVAPETPVLALSAPAPVDGAYAALRSAGASLAPVYAFVDQATAAEGLYLAGPYDWSGHALSESLTQAGVPLPSDDSDDDACGAETSGPFAIPAEAAAQLGLMAPDPVLWRFPEGAAEAWGQVTPATHVWLITSEGPCEATVLAAQVIVDPYCSIVRVVYPLSPACWLELGPRDTAPVALIAETLPPDVVWVAPQPHLNDVRLGSGGPLEVIADGRTFTVLDSTPTEEAARQQLGPDGWYSGCGEPSLEAVSLLHMRAEGRVFAVESTEGVLYDAWGNFSAYIGPPGAQFNCFCDDREGCVDAYLEDWDRVVQVELDPAVGPIQLDVATDHHLRGAVVEDGRFALLVWGNSAFVSVQRRIDAGAFGEAEDMGGWVDMGAEDPEPDPLEQGPGGDCQCE